MALFAISFMLEDGSDYNDRLATLVKAIEEAADGDVWSETASFFLVTSTKNSANLKDEIMASVGLQDGDVLLVINLSKTKGHSTHGLSKKTLFKKLIDQR
ncbi:hypothetical protein DevBK_06985 [Devosia sp. BK]|uniref:hypothetical protein n=1 Tax=unclassified Devosia TaxID=196773 RepID=UPI000713EDB1|nr:MULTISPECIES: hypothetical protein [unclassified Devosia]KQT51545.1 hypothetical protein ASG47_01230 [Devosia sp. Leaf420]MDV3251069.1 hypothetical protein [Devosia sp. BK]